MLDTSTHEVLCQSPNDGCLKVGIFQVPRVEDNKNPDHQRVHTFDTPRFGSIPSSFSPLPLLGEPDVPGWVPSGRSSPRTRQYVTCLEVRKAFALKILSVDEAPFKVSIDAGGVNVACADIAGPQDYFVAPDQQWIFGIRVRDGLVRQFQILEAEARGFSLGTLVHGSSKTNYIEIRIFAEKPEAAEGQSTALTSEERIDQFQFQVSDDAFPTPAWSACKLFDEPVTAEVPRLADSESESETGKDSMRDPVQEEADRAYRERRMQARMAEKETRSRNSSPDRSVIEKWDEEVEEPFVSIVTPPEMERVAEKSKFDGPNADVHVDNILPHFKGRLEQGVLPHEPVLKSRDPSCERERPLINIVLPTPPSTPSLGSQAKVQMSKQDGGVMTVSPDETHATSEKVAQAIPKTGQGKGRTERTKRIDWGQLARAAAEAAASCGAIEEPQTAVLKPTQSAGGPEDDPTDLGYDPGPQMPGAFADDAEFAAGLAAGLQHSGFDPNIVIDDPSYRRRESPPGADDVFYKPPFSATETVMSAEASVEEWPASRKKSKKDKKKKKGLAILWDDEPEPTKADPDPQKHTDVIELVEQTIDPGAFEDDPGTFIKRLSIEVSADDDWAAFVTKKSKKKKGKPASIWDTLLEPTEPDAPPQQHTDPINLLEHPISPGTFDEDTGVLHELPSSHVVTVVSDAACAVEEWDDVPVKKGKKAKKAKKAKGSNRASIWDPEPDAGSQQPADPIEFVEQTISTGGLIKQAIAKDLAPERWEATPFETVRIYIVDPEQFKAETSVDMLFDRDGSGSRGLPVLRHPPIVRDPDGLDQRLPSFAVLMNQMSDQHGSLMNHSPMMSFVVRPPSNLGNTADALGSVPSRGMSLNEEEGGVDRRKTDKAEVEVPVMGEKSVAPNATNGKGTDRSVDVFSPAPRPFWKICCCWLS